AACRCAPNRSTSCLRPTFPCSCCSGLSPQVGFALTKTGRPVAALQTARRLAFDRDSHAPVAAGSARKSASPLRKPDGLSLRSKPLEIPAPAVILLLLRHAARPPRGLAASRPRQQSSLNTIMLNIIYYIVNRGDDLSCA